MRYGFQKTTTMETNSPQSCLIQRPADYYVRSDFEVKILIIFVIYKFF